MRNNINRSIEIILKSLAQFPRPLDKEGNLDVKAFNEMPEVKEAIDAIKCVGVKTSNALAKRGFVAASMVLKF
jgi:hypothetical protein